MEENPDGDVNFHEGEIGISQCVWCRHRSADGRTCSAFPDGIPEAIASNRHDHRHAYDGDGGLTFEPEVVEIEFVDVDEDDSSPPGVESSAASAGSDPPFTEIEVIMIDESDLEFERSVNDLDAAAG
jgi:hypothetical protein